MQIAFRDGVRASPPASAAGTAKPQPPENARSCGVCLSGAVLAHRLVGEGRGLPEIRAAVDDAFR